MKTICCICQQTMKEGPTRDGKVSHGICDACMPQYMLDNGLEDQFYDRLFEYWGVDIEEVKT